MELRDKIVDELKNYVPMTLNVESVADAILDLIQPKLAGAWGPWIAWNGGECPVAGDTRVRGIEGNGPTSWEANATDNHWQSFRGAYQVWTPAQVVTLYGWSLGRAFYLEAKDATHTITGPLVEMNR